jgi:predicted MPP superfamily phosphohydrolase
VPAASEVRVVRHELELCGGLPRPLRVAFASDLHLGPTTASETLDAAFAALNEAAPDLLLLGGDYVFLDMDEALATELSRRVANVPAPVKLAVLGNHDLWTDTQVIEHALARAGVRVLVNDAVTLPEPFDEIAVLGIDDPWTGAPDADRAVRACGPARCRLALSHSPDGALFLANRGVRLMFCGHTHGGQIALPERPIVLPPGPYSKRFPWGLHAHADLRLFVSRGVGATELPIRLNAPSEIAIFEIR